MTSNFFINIKVFKIFILFLQKKKFANTYKICYHKFKKILKFNGGIVVENIISMNDMKKNEILDILRVARKIENCSEEEKLKFLHGKIISTLFFFLNFFYMIKKISLILNNVLSVCNYFVYS